MNNKFDELTKSLAQSVTRRAALKKFSVGLAGMALAALGLTGEAQAQTGCLPYRYQCTQNSDCCSGHCTWEWQWNWASKKKYKVWYCAL
jgi:hypothetical protein